MVFLWNYGKREAPLGLWASENTEHTYFIDTCKYFCVYCSSVEPRDKSFAGGFSMFISSLLALIPGPILFGRMIDSTCLVWSHENGKRGNCQLYDPIKFRQRLHTYLATFILFGTLFDLLVWYYGRSLALYGDDNKSMMNEMDESPEIQPLRKRRTTE